MLPCLLVSLAWRSPHNLDSSQGAPRYWPKYGGARQVTVLDGLWNYGYEADPNFDSMSKALRPHSRFTPNKTAVPSCMDVVAGGAAGYLGPRGVGMYKTSFASPATSGASVRLQFQSCSFYCRVWINGEEIGDHRAGGYVAFWLDVPAAALSPSGENELFVLADNRFNSTTAPMHTGGDFWHYGGLTRSVELHTMAASAPVLWRAYVLPSASDVTLAQPLGAPTAVDITLDLVAPSSSAITFSVAFDGGAASEHSGTVVKGKVLLTSVPVPDAKPWSPDSPHLHTVTVSVGGGSVTERFGLRRFGVEGGSARLTINGKVTKLVGWNHHTQWPVTAASPTDDQIDADIALLKKGNANLVRGAHYPHDPRWMDRLDEAGILFWSETLGPSVSLANTKDWKYFMKFQLTQLDEMLNNALNHASVYAWGWFNEGPSNEDGACDAYAACAKQARERDPTRFGTWADDHKLNGKCYESATLISFNDYPGWYDNSGNVSAPKKWNDFAAAVRGGSTASGKGTLGKPMMISETGAGGVFEWDANATDAKWTLKYQSEIIGGDVDVALANEHISAIALWHFYDFKVDNCGSTWPCPWGGQENNTHCTYDHEPPTTFEELASKGPPNCTYIEINGRPGGENHKGSLDFWRREKPAFKLVAAKYKAANRA